MALVVGHKKPEGSDCQIGVSGSGGTSAFPPEWIIRHARELPQSEAQILSTYPYLAPLSPEIANLDDKIVDSKMETINRMNMQTLAEFREVMPLIHEELQKTGNSSISSCFQMPLYPGSVVREFSVKFINLFKIRTLQFRVPYPSRIARIVSPVIQEAISFVKENGFSPSITVMSELPIHGRNRQFFASARSWQNKNQKIWFCLGGEKV